MNIPDSFTLQPHNNVFPIVAMTRAMRLGIHLGVVGVQHGSPAVVGTRSHIDIAVVKIRLLAALNLVVGVCDVASIAARVDGTVRAYGRGMVACVGVEVKGYMDVSESALFIIWCTVGCEYLAGTAAVGSCCSPG